ncbi:MAG: DNA alkylation repair protein [Saprospiraceae bacterium]
MKDLFAAIKEDFIHNSDEHRATGMSKYMRDKFVYFGISSPVRKEIQSKHFPKKFEVIKKDFKEFIIQCWSQDEREWKYLAMDFSQNYLKKGDLESLDLFENLIVDQSWWDTVDCLAANLLGRILRPHPLLGKQKMEEWIESDNFWLQRTAIILQLKYKENTDFELLKKLILRRASNKEFFIQKASGWALREYSKLQPTSVIEFVDSNLLAPLTKREALRLIK